MNVNALQFLKIVLQDMHWMFQGYTDMRPEGAQEKK